MTLITKSRTSKRIRQLTVGLLVLGSALAVTATDSVDARPRSKSEGVAAEANRALGALGSWQANQDPADYVRFVQARAETASMVAGELEADAKQLSAVWAATGIEKQQTLLAALTQLGVPYRSLKSLPGVGFDCSGLTIWAFGMAGLDIPRVSRDQIKAATEVDRADAEPGDLVYYPGHIGIYLGVNLMVHSPNSGSHVEAVQITTRRTVRFGDIAGAVISADQASAQARQSGAALVDGTVSVTQ